MLTRLGSRTVILRHSRICCRRHSLCKAYTCAINIKLLEEACCARTAFRGRLCRFVFLDRCELLDRRRIRWFCLFLLLLVPRNVVSFNFLQHCFPIGLLLWVSRSQCFLHVKVLASLQLLGHLFEETDPHIRLPHEGCEILSQ